MTDNQMRAERYLRSIKDAERNIDIRKSEIEFLRYKASGSAAITYDKDHVQTSPQDFMSLTIADVVDREKELEEGLARHEETKANAYRIIRQMEDVSHRTVLEWFYLENTSMLAIASKLNMSERATYYLRDDALEVFGSCMNKKFADVAVDCR